MNTKKILDAKRLYYKWKGERVTDHFGLYEPFDSWLDRQILTAQELPVNQKSGDNCTNIRRI